jgi:hypothetical protein
MYHGFGRRGRLQKVWRTQLRAALPKKPGRPSIIQTASSEAKAAVTNSWLGTSLVQSRVLLLHMAPVLAATVGIIKWYDRYYRSHPYLAAAVAELAAASGFRDHDVLMCLTLLAQRGLVRRLDAVQDLWEISHDFVARQLAILLGRLRPILFALILFALVAGLPWYIRDQAFSTLRGRNIAVVEDPKLMSYR